MLRFQIGLDFFVKVNGFLAEFVDVE